MDESRGKNRQCRPSGCTKPIREFGVAYMNVGKGTKAAHAFLRRCAESDVGIAFMGEAWVDDGGTGTQQHPDYVMLGRVFVGVKVVVLVRRDVVGQCKLLAAESRFVCVSIGGIRVGGVYGKCGEGVHGMKRWLDSIGGSLGAAGWMLVGRSEERRVGKEC